MHPRAALRPGRLPSQPRLWLVAVLFYGVGDVVTTSVGLGFDGVVEAGPVTAMIVQQYGLLSMVALKCAAFGGHYVLWRVIPRPHCEGVPLGLSIVGIAVTLWNLLVVLVVILP